MVREALLIALLAGVVHAAEPSSPELLLFDEPVVNAAAKYPQVAQEAPSAVTVLTREDIDRYGWRTLAEALRSVRGFYYSDDRNYAYTGVRGFLRPSDWNDRILLLINGHTYNDDIYGNALIGTEFGIDLEAVDHIEVIRGPGSALYGGNAVFAVVNVVTSTAAQRPGVHAVLETGSYLRKRAQGTVGHVFGNGAQLFASGSVFDVDGAPKLFYPPYASPRTNNGFAENADGDQAFNLFLDGRWGDFTLQAAANQREKQVPTGQYETTFDDPDTKTVDGRRFAEVQWSRRVLERLSLRTRVFYDGTHFHGTYIYGSGAERTKNEDRADSDWVGGEALALVDAFEGNRVMVGSEYSYHPDARQENFDILPSHTYLDVRRSFSVLGAYVQDEWRLLRTLTLTAGLRYDSYYGRVDHLSPRGALVWTPRPGSTGKLLLGNAFRPANLYEQYYAYAGAGTRSLRNPNLDPEQIDTYEAVWEQSLFPGATATLSLYRYDMHDLIDQVVVPRPAGSPETTQYRNVGDVQANGGEIELRTPLAWGFTGDAWYTLQHASRAGQELSNSPRHVGRVGVLSPVWRGFGAGAETILMSPRRTVGGRTVETSVQVNLNLVYSTPLPGLSFSAGLYNLLDRHYPDPVGVDFRQDRIAQNGLTFRTQLRYAW